MPIRVAASLSGAGKGVCMAGSSESGKVHASLCHDSDTWFLGCEFHSGVA